MGLILAVKFGLALLPSCCCPPYQYDGVGGGGGYGDGGGGDGAYQ